MGGKPRTWAQPAAAWPPEVVAQLGHGLRLALRITATPPEGSLPGEVAAALAATAVVVASTDKALMELLLAPAPVETGGADHAARVEGLARLGGRGVLLERAAETFTSEGLWVWSASVEELAAIAALEIRLGGRRLLAGRPSRVAKNARLTERKLRHALAALDKQRGLASPLVLRAEAAAMRFGAIAAETIADDQEQRTTELASRTAGSRKLVRQRARLKRFASVVYLALRRVGWERADIAALLVDADQLWVTDPCPGFAAAYRACETTGRDHGYRCALRGCRATGRELLGKVLQQAFAE